MDKDNEWGERSETPKPVGILCRHSQGQRWPEGECLDCNYDENGTRRKPVKAKQKTPKKAPAETPPGVPCVPWAKWTPSILGFVWHGKLWKDLNPFARVLVMMVQMAYLYRIEKGKTWDGVWRCYASRAYLAQHCLCDQATVYRVWLKLEEAGVIGRVKGTGRKGVTSEWILNGIGFPEGQAK